MKMGMKKQKNFGKNMNFGNINPLYSYKNVVNCMNVRWDKVCKAYNPDLDNPIFDTQKCWVILVAIIDSKNL